MKFNVNQQDLQQALNYCQGVIEKRSTLPILSNILLNAEKSKLTITATDLDLIFIHQINNVEVLEEGKTTTISSLMYDIVRKFTSGMKINVNLNERVFQVAKSHNRDILTVGGGPCFTSQNANEKESREFFKKQKHCDMYVINQGERGFFEIISKFLKFIGPFSAT